MNVQIDRSSCISCGACWNTCPRLFSQNPCDGFAEIVFRFRFGTSRADGVVPGHLVACAREASKLCPPGIIAVQEF
jgi:ferredoxin